MKAGQFKLSPYVVKDEGGKRYLIIDARDSYYIPSISDDRNARYQVLKILSEVEADLDRAVLLDRVRKPRVLIADHEDHPELGRPLNHQIYERNAARIFLFRSN